MPRRHRLSRKGAVTPLLGQLAWWQARALPRTDGRRAEQSPEHVAGCPVACALRLRFVQGPRKVGAWPGARAPPGALWSPRCPIGLRPGYRDRRRQGWRGPQVGVTLCPLPGQKGASPQAPSPKPGEGDALMLRVLGQIFKKFQRQLGRPDVSPYSGENRPSSSKRNEF